MANASSSFLDLGRNCWRIETADRAALVVDAADYFHHARKAMLKAEKQILLIGWDFDTRIFLDDGEDEAPTELGRFVSWLARNRPEVCIYILRWDWGAAKLLARGSTIFRLLNWARTKTITFKLDGAHPHGASHHQKIVVIDDRLAFCGGIDMTATRWDTREHLDHDDRRKRPTTGRRYQPWHDATMAVTGGAARALGDLARERWKTAGGEPIDPPKVSGELWPDELDPQFVGAKIAVARTRGEYKDVPEVREIEALYLDMIAAAKRYIYFENQFFASRVIAEAVAKRLEEPNGPEFVIVNPKIVDGWVEEEVMTPARAELLTLLRQADRHGRLRVYTPVTRDGCDIYVHSKIGIVDDRLLRVGSANLNNRSMGLDSECDLLLDTALPGNAGAGEQISARLHDLLGEHLGVAPDAVARAMAKSASLIAVIEDLRGSGRSLVPLNVEQPNAIEAVVAETEAMDPERPGTYFDTKHSPQLLTRLRRMLPHGRWKAR